MEPLEQRQLMAVTVTGTFLANQKSGIPVSSTDLINGLVPAPSDTNYVRSFEGGPIDNLTDGRTTTDPADLNQFSAQQNAVFSLDGGIPAAQQHGPSWYAIYRLPLTNAPAGYDISEIDSITGHQDTRTDQTIDIEVQFVGDPNFYSLSNNGNFAYRPGTGNGAAKLAITDDAGAPLARGVRAIKFEADQEAVYRELDVLGAASPVPTGAPAAPTNLAANVVGSDVTLSFTDAANNEAGYRIERAPLVGGTPGTFTQVASLGATSGTGGTVSYTDRTTLAGQAYQYRVTAYNAFNGGSSSTPVTVNATTPTTGTGLAAHYFGTTHWRGNPVATQIDPNLSDNDFGTGSPNPAVPVDQFSAIYSGKLTPTVDGNYQFAIDADDEGILVLNVPEQGGQIVIADTNSFPTGGIDLQAGHAYDIVYLASENLGAARFNLTWQPPGAPAMTAIPSSVLSSAMTPVTVAPDGLSSDVSATSVTVNFTDNSPNEAKYQLERATVTGGTPGPYTVVAEDAPNVAVLVDQTANAGTTYSYRVRAFNFEGSAASQPIQVTTPARTAASGATGAWFDSPFWGSAARPPQGSVGISSPPDYREEVGQVLFRQPSLDRPGIGIVEGGTGNGRGQYSTAFTGKLVAPETGDYYVLGFGDDDTHVWVDGQLASSDPGGHGTPANTAAGIGTIDVRNLVHLVQGQAYNFQVLQAEGGGGSEVILRWITPSMLAADPNSVAADVPQDALQNISDLPAAPGTGAAEAATATTATINFQDNSKSELRYRVEMSRTADFATIDRQFSTGINQGSFTVKGLTPGTQYFFRIRGTNLEGEGPAIVETVTTSATPVPPAAPSNLVLRTTSDRDFRLTFADNSNNEDNFVVSRRVGNTGDFTDVGVLAPGVTTFFDQVFPAPPRGTPVTYRVVSRNSEGSSTPVEATVLSGAPGGTGLTATAYPNQTWTEDPNQKTYLDPEVGENWSLGPPIAGIPEDNFSVAWTGQVQAEKTENYQFQVEADDQIELIITDQQGNELVNLPLAGGVRTSTAVPLVAGQRYNIAMKMFEATGGASAYLRWQSPTTPLEVIPQVFLFPTQTAGTSISDVYVRGSAWSTAFKSYLAGKGLGDANYGYRLLSNGNPVAGPAADPDQILPWINVNEVVLKYATAPTGSGVPQVGTVAFTSQRGVTYTVTSVTPVAGDPTAFVVTLNQPLGGGNPVTGVAPTANENGDRITLGVPGGGAAGGAFSLRMNVLQGDTDHTGENGTHSVLAADFSAVKKKFFKNTNDPVTGTDADYSVFHDVNGSGDILANDFSEVKKRFFQQMVAPPAAATAASPFSAARIAPKRITREVLG
jgi:hypothetical protein